MNRKALLVSATSLALAFFVTAADAQTREKWPGHMASRNSGLST